VTRQDSPSPRCLDGETLAAWSSGSLRASEAATVEQHLSNCERCQSMLATFVRIEPPPAAPESVWRRWHLAWLVPVATAATVTAIWVAIPTERRDSLQQSARFEAQSPDVAQPQPQPVAPLPAPAALPPARQAPRPASKSQRSDEMAVSTEKNESMLMKRRLRVSEEVAQKRAANEADRKASDSLGAVAGTARASAPAAAPPPPPPPAVLEDRAAAQARSAQEKVVVSGESPLADASITVIVSPVPSYRWRITAGRRVDRSSSGGEQWQRVAIPDSERLTAGHSPSASVAWLIGPAGTIYMTSDGTRFEKIPFIEPVDLVSVVAIDDRQATVTTADGGAFRTMDRGVTWIRVP
jgi:hypothetical protein